MYHLRITVTRNLFPEQRYQEKRIISFIYWVTVLILKIRILTMLLKVSIKEEIGNILGIIVFILFTTAMNVMFVNVKSGIMIGVKLILVCNITFIPDNIVVFQGEQVKFKTVYGIKIDSKDDYDEVKEAVKIVEEVGNRRIVILHCVSIYPTPIEKANLLNMLAF